MGELWTAFATPLRAPLVVTVPSETLVAVAAAHGVVDVVALARAARGARRLHEHVRHEGAEAEGERGRAIRVERVLAHADGHGGRR